jgi:hypothetical protein
MIIHESQLIQSVSRPISNKLVNMNGDRRGKRPTSRLQQANQQSQQASGWLGIASQQHQIRKRLLQLPEVVVVEVERVKQLVAGVDLVVKVLEGVEGVEGAEAGHIVEFQMVGSL